MASPRRAPAPMQRGLLGDCRGANLVEYMVLVGFVALVALVGLRTLGISVSTKIQCQATSIAGGGSTCPGDAPAAYAMADGNSGPAGSGGVQGPGAAGGPGAGDGSGNAAQPADPASLAPPMELAAHTEDGGGGNPVWGFIKQVGGVFGGIGYGIGADAVGLWDLVTNPWGTIKDAGKGIWNIVKTRLETAANKAVDQWKNGDKWGAAWTLAKGYWSATSGVVIETLVIDEGVKEDWAKGNYGGAIGRVTWNVGSWFIPGAGWALRGGKIFSKFSKAGKAAKAAEEAAKVEKAAKAAEEAAKAKKAQEIATKAVDEAKQLPTKLESGFGHGGTKHAPKTPADEAKIAKGDFQGKSITFFDDEAALARAVEQAPTKLPEALAKDPAKAAQWDEFVNNPKEGDKFGFVYEADGPVGRGYTKNPDGTVSPSGPLNHVYIQYQWVKGPGGKLVPKVKNVYPKQVPPAATAGNPGGPVVAGSPGDVPEDEDEGD